jgi:hypothetical protein
MNSATSNEGGGNFTQVPNAIIRASIAPIIKAVLAAIISRFPGNSRGPAYPSLARIAEDASVGLTAAKKAVKALVGDLRILNYEPGSRDGQANRYFLNDEADWNLPRSPGELGRQRTKVTGRPSARASDGLDLGQEVTTNNTHKNKTQETIHTHIQGAETFKTDADSRSGEKLAKQRSATEVGFGPAGLMKVWNQNCGILTAVTKLTAGRTRLCKLRLKENPEEGYWVGVITRMAASRFVCGQGPPGDTPPWRANFDWLIKNDLNHVKVMEGNYDDLSGQHKSKKIPTINGDDDVY